MATNEKLYIEFHPGDTIYFVDNEEIGCTGPEYFIHKLDWQKFVSYTRSLSNDKKMLLLPMVAIEDGKREELKQIIIQGLKLIDIINESDYERIGNAVIENWLIK